MQAAGQVVDAVLGFLARFEGPVVELGVDQQDAPLGGHGGLALAGHQRFPGEEHRLAGLHRLDGSGEALEERIQRVQAALPALHPLHHGGQAVGDPAQGGIGGQRT